jgi:hypothetical protein
MIQWCALKARLFALALLLAACGASNAAPAPTTYAGCARQEAVCEASCEPRELPGSSEKEPAMRGDLEAERCREQCRTAGCTGP